MVLDLIIAGTFALAAALLGGAGMASKNAGSTRRVTKSEEKVVEGKIKYDSSKARKRLKKGIVKANFTMFFNNKDLLMDANSFSTSSNVNDDSDFEPLIKIDSYRGHGELRRLYRYKGKKCVKDLGRGLSDGAKKRREEKLAKFENGTKFRAPVKDVIKESGFIKSKVEDYGINGSYIVTIAKSKTGKEFHACRYAMASKPVVDTITKNEQFRPSSLFGKLLAQQTSDGKSYIRKYGSKNLTFARFGVDYPIETGVDADRFILGCSNLNNPMYQASKLLVLAKACQNFNASRRMLDDGSVEYGIDKVRIIEGTRGKEKATVLKTDKFKEYVSAYVASDEYINSLNELGALDPKAVDYIEGVVNEFVPTRIVESTVTARLTTAKTTKAKKQTATMART